MSVFVKICGITSEEDALLAVAMGADAVGFVFAPSPRQVQPPVVADIVKRLPPEIMTVGVFRDEAPQRVIDLVNKTGLFAAQLHGHESPEVTKAVKEHVRFVIKGFAASEKALDHYADHHADAILIDAPSPGSGQLFDWSLSDRVSDRTRLVLAGGLTADNVAEAISAVQPWGVDVSTGVESTPGHKDAVKLRAFLAAAKAVVYERDLAGEPGLEDERPFDWRTDT
ncbi:MAG TPA: phosphoribosylanthranilate isomerase [Acidimicrobiales bacterium]|nr:phosphoribosylanthranilate isomerase [Acidimicrobiales bacterium]